MVVGCGTGVLCIGRRTSVENVFMFMFTYYMMAQLLHRLHSPFFSYMFRNEFSRRDRNMNLHSAFTQCSLQTQVISFEASGMAVSYSDFTVSEKIMIAAGATGARTNYVVSSACSAQILVSRHPWSQCPFSYFVRTELVTPVTLTSLTVIVFSVDAAATFSVVSLLLGETGLYTLATTVGKRVATKVSRQL